MVHEAKSARFISAAEPSSSYDLLSVMLATVIPTITVDCLSRVVIDNVAKKELKALRSLRLNTNLKYEPIVERQVRWMPLNVEVSLSNEGEPIHNDQDMNIYTNGSLNDKGLVTRHSSAHVSVVQPFGSKNLMKEHAR